MDNEFDPSATDISDAIEQIQTGPRVHAISAMDNNPDDGARALELGQVSGLPPEIIHDDLPKFEAKAKSSLIHMMLDENPQIREYIRANPIAATVSNDDYHNLDVISKTVPGADFVNNLIGIPSGMVQQTAKIARTLWNSEESGIDTLIGAIPDAILGGAQGIYEGVTAPPEPGHYDESGKWIKPDWQQLEELDKAYPIAGLPLKYAYGVKDIGKRAMGAAMGGMFGAPVAYAKAVAKGLGLSDTEVEQIGRDFEGGLVNYLSQNETPAHIRMLDANISRWKNIEASVAVMDDVTEAAKPWVDAGLTPPSSVHPALTKFYADTNTAIVDQLFKNLEAVRNAATTERSQELMQKFLAQHYENATIGISPEGILKLYGGKAPELDDGILGWVPDLEDQLISGGDIHIPIKDWMTKVDPSVAQALKDDIRTEHNFPTANEAKEPPVTPPAVDSPLAQVRAAMGTEPMFALGDRKLTLKPQDSFVYHGGKDKVSQPDFGRAGETSGMNEGRVFWVTPSKESADRFSFGGQTSKFKYKPKNPLEVPTDWSAFGQDVNAKEKFTSAAIEQARAAGHDAVVFKDSAKTDWFRGEDEIAILHPDAISSEDIFHEFKFHDDQDRPVGELTIIPDPENKTLWVANINGIAGLYSNSFGPSLIRDLKKQLKTFYPEGFDWIQGHRVSGAREKAGTQYDDAVSMPKVRLSIDDPAADMGLRDILAGKYTETISKGIRAQLLDQAELSPKVREAAAIVHDEFNRMLGDYSKLFLRGVMTSDKYPGQTIGGLSYGGRAFVNLFSENPVGTLRHESIHELRRLGFFKDEEWAALEQAAKDNDWAGKFKVRERYGDIEDWKVMEESIADAFRDWKDNPEGIFAKGDKRNAIFQKLVDLWNRIVGRLREKGIDPEVLFQQASSGELLRRKMAEDSAAKTKADLGIDLDRPSFSVEGDPKDNVTSFRKFNSLEEVSQHTSPKIEENQAKLVELESKWRSIYNNEYLPEYIKADAAWKETQTNDNPSWHGDDYIDHMSERGGHSAQYMTRLKNEANKVKADIVAEQLSAALPKGYRVEVDMQLRQEGGEKYQKFMGGEQEAWLNIYNKEGKVVGSTRAYSALSREGSWLGDLVRQQRGRTIDDILGNYPGDEPMFSVEDTKAQLDNLRAATVGLDAKTWKEYQEQLLKRHEEDIAAAKAHAEKVQRKAQTKEWKAELKQLRGDVEKKIRFRPDVLADMLIGSGDLAGQPTGKMFNPLRASDLTEEQKAGLPRRYYSENGFAADDVAQLTGFQSGQAMIEALIEYNKDRSGLTSKEHLRKVVDAETERQMVQKNGELEANIMRDALDQALSETEMNLILQEWQGRSMQAGVPPIDKEFVKAGAMEVFNKLKVGNIDSAAMKTQMLKHYDKAYRAWINGDSATSLQHMQRRYELALIAKEAAKLEKARAALDRTAKWAKKRDLPTVAKEFISPLQLVMSQVGYKTSRTADELRAEIRADGYKDLETFAASMAGQLRPVQVWDQLFDPTFAKTIDEMTPEEFYAVRDTMNSILKQGRMEKKVDVAGAKADLDAIVGDLVKSLEDNFSEIDYNPKGHKRTGGIARKVLDTVVAYHINMENTLNRWDGFNPDGLWQQTVLRGLHEGAGDARKLQKKVAEILLNEVKTLKKRDLRRTIENPLFRAPGASTTLPFTRQNLITVMLNTGTKSNLVKMAKGYELEPDAIMAWVHKHATKAEWDFVQSVWNKVFGLLKEKHDNMMRQMDQMPVKSVAAEPIQTKFGEYAGGYFPVIPHSEFPQKSATLIGKDPLVGEGFYSAVPEPGFTKDRTGWSGPIELELDQIPNRIGQMIHDIAMRPALVNAHKIFKDPRIQQAVFKHYGAEYKNELIPYIRGLTNAANFTDKNSALLAKIGNFFRTNMVSSLIVGNLSTVFKHTPTAFMTSLKEIGPTDFARGVRALFTVNEETGERNYDMMMRLSNEMALRDKSWEETTYGAAHELIPGGFTSRLAPMRAKIMQYGTKPVAFGDFISAGPTWMGKYLREIDNGRSVGDAAHLADVAVRRAHGSTALPNRTPAQREISKWFTSIFNFWSDIMNRQMETLWKAGEAAKAVKAGEWKKAGDYARQVATGTFAYVIWPALIEHMVTGPEEDESWAAAAGKSLAHTLSGGWIGVRDFVSALFYNRDPQYGLVGTALNQGRRIINDVLTKDDPWAQENRNSLIQHGSGLAGLAFGLTSEPMGRALGFTYDLKTGQQTVPQGPWEWTVGLRYGKTQGHSTSFQEYKDNLLRR